MFDVARLNLAGQWHKPSLGLLAELLVFYDWVDIRSPVGRLGGLLPNEIDDLRLFRELVLAAREPFARTGSAPPSRHAASNSFWGSG